MKISLVGYGKMGKVIEHLATDRGHTISYKIDLNNNAEIEQISPANTDVVIEFSQPMSAYDNITKCLNQKVKVISGTTGWLDKYEEVKLLCENNKGTFMHSSNFSLGVNIFFELNKWLGSTMSPFSEYQPEMEEIHHLQKLDKPSGTAITLAEGIIETHATINRWKFDKTEESALGIKSWRQIDVPGTHTVSYKSGIDTIEIKHTAHTRDGFAIGALKVAEWISEKEGVYTMNDYIKITQE